MASTFKKSNIESLKNTLLSIIFLSLIPAAGSQSPTNLVTVQAELNPDSNTLFYNGHTYLLSSGIVPSVPVGDPEIPMDGSFAFHVVMTVLCVMCAALAAGLTMGLVSLEPFDMQILMEASVDDCLTDNDRHELIKEKVG